MGKSKARIYYGHVRVATDEWPPHIWLESPYNRREDARRLKEVIGAGQWDGEAKVWRYPYNDWTEQDIEGWLKTLFPTARLKTSGGAGEVELIDHGPPLAEQIEPAEYDWRRTPYRHQRMTVAATRDRSRILVLDQMGTGKTQGAIDAACVAMEKGEVERCVIICPTSLRATWQEEIQSVAWMEPESIAVVKNNPPASSGERLRGASDKEYRTYQLRRRARWTIIHYPVLRRHIDDLRDLVRGQFLVCDESQKLKNRDAKVTKVALSLEPAKSIWQTGTPVENSPEDVWTALHFCDEELAGSFYGFRDRYCVVRKVTQGKAHFDLVVSARNLNELRGKLFSVGLRRRKEDVLPDLPPKIRHHRDCEMSTKQAKAYAEMRDELKTFFEERDEQWFRVEAANVRSRMIRLCQLADGYASPEPGKVGWFGGGKLEAATDIAEEVCAEQKMVVWSHFVPPTRKLMEELSDYNPVRIAGEIPQEDRQAAVDRFMQDDDCRVFVGQYQTAGLGLNLQAGTVVVLYDLWWNPAVVEQAIDRCHRSGQTLPVDVITLLAEGTVDAHVQRMIEKKSGWAGAVTGDVDEGDIGRSEIVWGKSDVLKALEDE
jgi:SNF2 family DNA or RNA helicase